MRQCVDYIGRVTPLRSLEITDGKTILLPELRDDVRIVSRNYYNRFLNKQLSNPLPDAKQLILFKAMDTKNDKEQIARGLDVLTEHCTRETLARIYAPIRRVS